MKIIYQVIGSLSLVLGVIGIFVPLLPTTPFLLLSAALYCRSSPRLYDWLLNHRCLGRYIREFREHRAMPLRAKCLSVSLLWLTMLHCMFFLVQNFWLRLLLFGVAASVTGYILSLKTSKQR